MSKPIGQRRWSSFAKLANRSGALAQAPSGAQVQSAELGLWVLARDEQGPAARASAALIGCVVEQVRQGEDLTAAFLVGHGRLPRDGHVSGAQIIGVRLNRASASFELAWVGPAVQAYLIRQNQLIDLCKASHASEEGRAHPMLIRSEQVSALGGQAGVRPKINRNLGQAQKGDYLALASGLDEGLRPDQTLAALVKGLWSLEYKTRRMQETLQGLSADEPVDVMLCQIR